MVAGAIATIIELLGYQRGCPVSMTVSAAEAVPKGTLMKVANPRTVSAAVLDVDFFMGVAAEEHKAASGTYSTTTMTVYTHGIFEMTSQEAFDAGNRLCLAVDGNKVKHADAAVSAENLFSSVGIALETTAADNERAAVLIGSGF